jgi:hypothetical protein
MNQYRRELPMKRDMWVPPCTERRKKDAARAKGDDERRQIGDESRIFGTDAIGPMQGVNV